MLAHSPALEEDHHRRSRRRRWRGGRCHRLRRVTRKRFSRRCSRKMRSKSLRRKSVKRERGRSSRRRKRRINCARRRIKQRAKRAKRKVAAAAAVAAVGDVDAGLACPPLKALRLATAAAARPRVRVTGALATLATNQRSRLCKSYESDAIDARAQKRSKSRRWQPKAWGQSVQQYFQGRGDISVCSLHSFLCSLFPSLSPPNPPLSLPQVCPRHPNAQWEAGAFADPRRDARCARRDGPDAASNARDG